MSLLLEALKKAEDDMRRRHPGGMSLQQDLPPEPAGLPPAASLAAGATDAIAGAGGTITAGSTAAPAATGAAGKARAG